MMFNRIWICLGLFLTLGAGCPQSEVPKGSADAQCVWDDECVAGQVCISGICRTPTATETDSGNIEPPLISEDGGLLMGVLEPVAPGALEFGAQRLGISVQRTVSFKNVGAASLNIVHISINNDAAQEFNVYPNGTMEQLLRIGDTIDLTVSHTPVDATADFSELQIVHTGESGLTQIELQAEFKGNPEVWISDTPYGTQAPSISEIDFGEVMVGTTSYKKVYVRNTGSSDSVIALTGWMVNPTTGEFESFPEDLVETTYLSSFLEYCSGPQDCSEDYPVCEQSVCFDEEGRAASTYDFDLFYAPNTPGELMGSLSINGYGNDEGTVSSSLVLKGFGLQGNLSAEPTLLVFDDAFATFPQTRTVALKNIGDAPLMIEQMNWLTGDAFSAVSLSFPVVLQVEETLDIEVTFLGLDSLGLAADALQIETDVQEPLTVEVRAEVKEAPMLGLYRKTSNALIPLDAEEPFDLGHVVLGQQREAKLVVVNEGPGDLRLDDLRLADSSANQFALGALNTFPLTLLGGIERTDAGIIIDDGLNADGGLDFGALDGGIQSEHAYLFSVIYQATTLSNVPDEAHLEIQNSDPAYENDVALLPLRALTVDPVLAIVPGALDFGDHLFDPQAETVLTLTLSNEGEGPLTVLGFDWDILEPRLRLQEEDFPFRIQPGETKEFLIVLQSLTLGEIAQQLIIEAPTREEGRFHAVPMTAEIVPGQISFSVSPLDFGEVFKGYEKELGVTITNTGTVTVNLEGHEPLSSESAFSINDASFLNTELMPNESTSITLTFSPDTNGVYEEDFTLKTNMFAQPLIQLKGESMAVPKLGLFINTPEGLTPLSSESAFDIGHVVLGQQREMEMVVLNQGSGALDLESIALAQGVSEQFSLGSLTAFPVTLTNEMFSPDAGLSYEGLNSDGGVLSEHIQAYRFSIFFQATTFEGAPDTTQLELISNDPTVSQGVSSFSLSGLTVDPKINLSPDTLNWGDHLYMPEGLTNMSFEISNAGQGPLTVSQIFWELGNDILTIQAPSQPFVIEAGQSQAVTVELSLDVLGVFEASLMVEAATREEGLFHTLIVSGAVVPGTLAFVPEVLDFGDVFRGYDKTLTVQMLNSSTVPIVIESANILLGEAFSFAGPVPQSTTLSPNEQLGIDIQFEAVDVSSFSDSLSIQTNMYADPTFSLIGEGKTPPGLVMYDTSGTKISLDTLYQLGDVRIGETKSWTLRLANDEPEGILSIENISLGELSDAGFAVSFPSSLSLPQSLAEYNEEDLSTYIEFVLSFSPQETLSDGNGGLGFSAVALVLESDDPTQPFIEVSMQGRAINPVASIVPVVFEDALVGGTALAQVLAIENTGQGPLTLESVYWLEGEDSNIFSLGNIDFSSVPAGQTRHVEISFLPLTEANYAQTLKVDLGDGLESEIVSVAGNGVLGEITAAPLSVDFGLVFDEASSSVVEVLITNTGTVALPISSLFIVGGDNNFEIVNPLAWNEVVLERNNDKILRLQYNATTSSVAPQEQTATVQVVLQNTSSTIHPRFLLPLNATTQKVPASSLCIGTQDTCSNLPATAIDLGDTVMGQEVSQTFWVKNVGEGQLTIVSSCFLNALSNCSNPSNINGAFTFEAIETAVVSPGAVQPYIVKFAPTGLIFAPLSQQVNLEIATNDPNQPLLSINVNARAIAPEGTLSWAGTFNGQFEDALVYGQNTLTQDITLTNSGVGPLSLASASLTGDAGFTLTFNDLTDLAQGESRTGEVQFLPTAEGDRNATVAIDFEGGVAPVSLQVSGVGIVGSFDAENTNLSFTFQGNSRIGNITLTNTTTVSLPVTGILETSDVSNSFVVNDGESLGVFTPGESKIVTIVFTPITDSQSPMDLLASYEIQLDVQGNYQNPFPSFNVSGSSQLKPNAGLYNIEPDDSTGELLTDGAATVNIDLGDVVAGQTASYRFRLKNTMGELPTGQLEIQQSCFADGPCNSPSNESGFYVYTVNTGEVPQILNADDSVDYAIVFNPTGSFEDVITQSASLAIQTNDPQNPTLAVLIQARVIAPQPSVAWVNSGEFGKVLVERNQAEMRTLRIHNDGAGPLTLMETSLSGDADFSIEGSVAGIDVAAGSYHDVVVAFAPSTSGIKNASVLVGYSGGLPSSNSMAMTGEGLYASLSPVSFVFGNAYYDEPNNQTIVITNNGEVPFSFAHVSVINDATGSFTLNNLETLLGAGEIVVGESVSISMTYQPKVLNETSTVLNAEIRFTINAGGGYGEQNHPVLSLSGPTQGRSEINVTPLSHDFGEVMVGTTQIQTFVISNTGSGVLTLDEVCFIDSNEDCLTTANVDGFFSYASNLPSSLAPNATFNWTVQYAPTGSQLGTPLETATLRIRTNDEQDPSVSTDIDETVVSIGLQGKAISPDSSLSWPGDFISTLVYGQTWVYRTLTVSNDGTGDLSIINIQLADSSVGVGEDPEFSIIEPTNTTIGENESRDITVGFRPTGPGLREADVVISFSGLPDKTQTVRGTGVYGELSPSLYTFQKTWVGDQRTGVVTVTNTSPVDLPLGTVGLFGADAVHYAIMDITYEASNTADGILDAGRSIDVTVKFEPNGAAISSIHEVSLSDAHLQFVLEVADGYPSSENPIEVSLQGSTQKKPDIAVYEADGSTLLIADSGSTGNIDLGDVVVGQTVTRSFRIKNDGAGQLSLLESCFANSGCNATKHVDGNYSYITSHTDPLTPPPSLAPNAYVDYTLSFTPTANVSSPVAEQAYLVIESNDPDAVEQSLVIMVSARIIDPQPELEWTQFSDTLVYLNTAVEHTLTINNNNGGPLTISDVALTSGTDFTYTLNDYSTIAAGASRNIIVSFLPTTDGFHAATLTVNFNAGVDSETITITGTGVYGSLNATNTDFGFLFKNEALVQTLTLTNSTTTALPLSQISIDPVSNNFSLIDDSSGTDVVTNVLNISNVLAVNGSATIKVRFNPAESNASITSLSAVLKASLDVQSGYPDAALPRVSITGESHNKPDAQVQLQQTDGTWSEFSSTTYDWGDIYNNDDANPDREIKFRLLNANTAGYGGDLTVSQLCVKHTYHSDCYGNTPVGDFELVDQITSDTIVSAGNAVALTVKYNPSWSNSGQAADAVDIKYSTNAPELSDAEIEINVTSVKPKLWLNDVSNGGGMIPPTDFFDYNERTTSYGYGTQDIYNSSTREYHLRNYGGASVGTFPTQTHYNWGQLVIKSIEIVGGGGAFTLVNEYRRCPVYKYNPSGESSDRYWLSINASICSESFSLPQTAGYFYRSSTSYDNYTYRTKVEFQPTEVQSYNATLKITYNRGKPEDETYEVALSGSGQSHYPNAETNCDSNGNCSLGDCYTNYHNNDSNDTNGCEYYCVFGTLPDVPDNSFIDSDCDGFDGDFSEAIFVKTNGIDTNSGETTTHPVKSINTAINKAVLTGKDVYVAEGTYTEANTIVLSSGVSVYGGFDSSTWARSNFNNVQINVSKQKALSATSIYTSNRVTVDRIKFKSTTNEGSNSYGLYAYYSSGLTFNQVTLEAVSAADGSDGVNGTINTSNNYDGDDGSNGSKGASGCEQSGGTFCGSCSRPQGGSGGSSECSSPGGKGGNAGHDDSDGYDGACGQRNGICATDGGTKVAEHKGNWTPSSTNACIGDLGAEGSPGTNGSGGYPVYLYYGYSPSHGDDGAWGQHGAGGGGGGGGGGGDNSCNSYGGGGGGGGAGGCGGAGATGGDSGGGSFAAYLWNSSPIFTNVTFKPGSGGDGGDGGLGQSGGAGGAPGRDGTSNRGNSYGGGGEQDDGSNGCRGGSGGEGGRGGHGGAGAGGPTICIVKGGTSNPTLTSPTYSNSSVSGGSAGTTDGYNAADGSKYNTYTP